MGSEKLLALSRLEIDHAALRQVLISGDNKLGTTTSSKPFTEEIRPMDRTSEAPFELKPVAFRYKKDIDPAGTRQLGLVAEDVDKR